MRAALDPKYAHLNDDLHVEISALAPPGELDYRYYYTSNWMVMLTEIILHPFWITAEAYARVAYALAEVRKYLIPDSNDVIRQEQLRELIADGTIPGDTDSDPKYKPRAPHITRTAYPSR